MTSTSAEVHQVDEDDWVLRDAAGKALAIIWRSQLEPSLYRGALLNVLGQTRVSLPDFDGVVEHLRRALDR